MANRVLVNFEKHGLIPVNKGEVPVGRQVVVLRSKGMGKDSIYLVDIVNKEAWRFNE